MKGSEVYANLEKGQTLFYVGGIYRMRDGIIQRKMQSFYRDGDQILDQYQWIEDFQSAEWFYQVGKQKDIMFMP